ncbi:glycosyltransferase family 4 protein [Tepidibacillus sp. LV47]|uniref:glycosyltransferase family 4 protein n=1 Tax=Tepidibacillus sp. LV47 TaxID=3398228 RepID=UPI003AACD747
MKILIFNTVYYPNIVGGAEKSVQLLAEGLVERGHEPVIVSTEKNDHDRVDWVNGIKVYYLHPRNLYWGIESNKKNKLLKPIWHALDIFNPFFKKVLTNIIKTEQPDVIHTNNLAGFSVIPWVIAKEFKIPVVHTLRDYYLMCVKSTMYHREKNCENRQCGLCSLYTSFKKYLSNKQYVHYLIGISDFMIQKHKLFGYFTDVPSKRIFNGIRLPQIEGSSNNKNVSKPLKFFYMGRIEKTKGVNLLLKEFEHITNAELYLAGRIIDPIIKVNIEKNFYKGNIHFIGYVDPKDVLPEMDILIAPSLWHEPFGRILIEAFQFGKPVIASNRGGIPEVVEDGVTGYIFNPDIEGDLREKINKFILNPSIISEMAKKIPKFMNEFDIDRTVNQYIEVYTKTIDKNKKG